MLHDNAILLQKKQYLSTTQHLYYTYTTLGTKGYKNTLRISSIYCFSTAKMVVGTRSNIMLYVYFLACIAISAIIWFSCIVCKIVFPTLKLFQSYIQKDKWSAEETSLSLASDKHQREVTRSMIANTSVGFGNQNWIRLCQWQNEDRPNKSHRNKWKSRKEWYRLRSNNDEHRNVMNVKMLKIKFNNKKEIRSNGSYEKTQT